MYSIKEKCNNLEHNGCAVVYDANELENLLSECNIKEFINKKQNWNDGDTTIKPNIIICEGDSWFSYALIVEAIAEKIQKKLTNTNKSWSNNNKPWVIVNLAKNGDKVCNMFSQTSNKENQSQTIIDIIKQYQQQVKYLLLSGGGNDFIDVMNDDINDGDAKECNFGNNFLRQYKDDITDCIDKKNLKNIFQKIYGLYNDFFIKNQDSLENVKIIMHTYDDFKKFGTGMNYNHFVPPLLQIFLPPQVNLLGTFVVKNGPWLSKAMDAKNIPNNNGYRKFIVKYLLDEYKAQILSPLAENYANITITNLRDTLPDAGNDWKDEIHPSYTGAKKIAIKFVDKINL